jgi:hypothetical protein
MLCNREVRMYKVPVTIVYPGGGMVNVNVPYCDTIRIRSKKDSIYFKAKAL